jgi:hypothetical protein
MHFGDENVFRVLNRKREAIAAFAALLFGLQGNNFPVGRAQQLYFVADMVLARELIDVSFGFRVGNIEAGLRERIRRPYVGERPAAAICDPEAGVLRIPPVERIRIAAMRAVVRIYARPSGLFVP